ncbi:hypothetical protein C0J52_28054, partial [Blattella germanica]
TKLIHFHVCGPPAVAGSLKCIHKNHGPKHDLVEPHTVFVNRNLKNVISCNNEEIVGQNTLLRHPINSHGVTDRTTASLKGVYFENWNFIDCDAVREIITFICHHSNSTPVAHSLSRSKSVCPPEIPMKERSGARRVVKHPTTLPDLAPITSAPLVARNTQHTDENDTALLNQPFN